MFKKVSLILILLLPVFLTGCARAQGALAPTGQSSPAQEMAPIESNPDQFLPQVEPASLEPIINYVDGLNLALTGDFSPLRASALVGCGCLAIANRLENLFDTLPSADDGMHATRPDPAPRQTDINCLSSQSSL